MVESFSFPGCSRLQVISLKTPQPTCSCEDKQFLSKSKNDTSNWFSCNFPVTFNHNCHTPNSPIVFISTYYMCVCRKCHIYMNDDVPAIVGAPNLINNSCALISCDFSVTSPSSASAYPRLVGCHVALYCIPNTVHSLSGS